jgi:hypothetical protein
MSGDGLTDLLRVKNGEIVYWPNTGYGTFGAKVTMDNSPWFEDDELNSKYIQIADIDGSGPSDILHFGSHGVDLYLNQSGNRFSLPRRLMIFPETNSLSNVTALDLLGTGTISLVWSSSLPETPVKYVDFTNGRKPHLLTGKANNLGVETQIHYAPSTKFYLEDKQHGRPWVTRLPFPVQCVEKVEIFDHVTHNRLVNRYAYHHGYFDNCEREYRGFGMVEQWDTEDFETQCTHTSFTDTASNLDPTWHVPPAYRKTWFHTGAFLEGESLERLFANEYFGASSSFHGNGKVHSTPLGIVIRDSVISHNLRYHEQRGSISCSGRPGTSRRDIRGGWYVKVEIPIYHYRTQLYR